LFSKSENFEVIKGGGKKVKNKIWTKTQKITMNHFCAIATHCFIIPLSHYQPQSLDFNPQLWKDELSVLPLYQYRWHVTIKFSRGGERTWDLFSCFVGFTTELQRLPDNRYLN
jgi:hypothetical protein